MRTGEHTFFLMLFALHTDRVVNFGISITYKSVAESMQLLGVLQDEMSGLWAMVLDNVDDVEPFFHRGRQGRQPP